MRKHFQQSNVARTGAFTALLLSFCCTSVFASNGFKSPCGDASSILSGPKHAAFSLDVKLIDHGLTDAAADINLPPAEPTKEELPSPALADIANSTDADGVEENNENDETTAPVSGTPETALRLPGVAEKDQPRFRHRMNRTDI